MRQSGPVSFGELLRQYRLAAGLSREALAERAGLSARGIQDLERGVNRAPRADTVALLFGALELAPEEQAALEGTISRHRKPYSSSAVVEERGSAASSRIGQALPIGGFLGALPDNRLVGRDSELDQMLEAVQAVVGGAGRLITLVGEPGIGKTRLAQEVTLHLRNRGFLVATGRCYEPQQTVPYYPFLDALASAYTAAPAAVRAEVPRRWPHLALLLPDAIGTQAIASSEGRDEQQRLFQAVTGFLTALAEAAPLALLLDDLHWADTTSLELLQHLARHARSFRVLLLGTYRDVEVQRQHPLRQALRDLNREHLLERVAVRRFGQDGTAALMAAILGEPEVSPEFAALVHRHTEGNPFFTDEVVRALIDRGDLYREDGHWTRRAIEEIGVPESIRDAIGERLSHLTEKTQDLLRQASVLGQSFDFEELRSMSSSAEEDVEQALDVATAAGLIREIGREGYEFSHALIQQSLYQELSSRQRRRLHRAAGEALEQPLRHGERRPTAELARHFLEADDAERALRYALLAAEEAYRLGAWSEGERHGREALQLAREVGDQEREAEALLHLASSLYFIGHYREAVEIVNEATSLVEASGNLVRLSRWLMIDGRFHLNLGEFEQSKSCLERAIQLADRTGDAVALADAVLVLASVFFFQGDWPAARRYLEQVVELTRDRDVETAVWGQVDLAKLALVEGDYESAASHVQQCIRKAPAIPEAMLGLYGQLLLAQLELLEGHPHAALARMDGLRDDQRFGWENIVEVLPVLAETYVALGDLARAEEVAAECVREAREMSYRLELPVALATLGMVLTRQRRWEDAARVLEEAISSAHELPYPYIEARALHQYGMMLAARPHAGDALDPDRARHVVTQALTIFRELGAKKDVEQSEQTLAAIAPR
jgi:tetratricopeptide (TPR) repeat protein/transcriptional regulator with XRE-family HTH domain